MKLKALAESLGLAWQGDAELEIRSLASLSQAGLGDLCFLKAPRLLENLEPKPHTAYLIASEWNAPAGNFLFSSQPQLDFVRAIALLKPARVESPGIHATAVIGADCKIHPTVHIAAGCVIEEGVQLDEGVQIGALCYVGRNSRIGAHTCLHARVSVEYECEIGADCLLHSGVVVGSDGFGLVETPQGWVKMPQLGRVIIKDRVEIGANTTIDRGALDDTVLHDGVKLDNQIQIAHNVVIGENTAMAACVGVAGSARIGKNCRISGAAVVLGHLQLADNVTITAMSLVTKSIEAPGVYSSGTPLLPNRAWNKTNARYKSLDELAKRLADLEKHALNKN